MIEHVGKKWNLKRLCEAQKGWISLSLDVFHRQCNTFFVNDEWIVYNALNVHLQVNQTNDIEEFIERLII